MVNILEKETFIKKHLQIFKLKQVKKQFVLELLEIRFLNYLEKVLKCVF